MWLVTPPEGFEHPKTEVLRMAARRYTLALCVRKVNISGEMRVVARGTSDDLAGFHGDLYHKQKDEGWLRNELVTTPNDELELLGRTRGIVRSDDAVAGGADSSGRERENEPATTGDTSSVDTGSTASSRLIVSEVRRERERGEALLEAARLHEAAALEAAAAREAAALEAAAAREAAALEKSIVALMTHAKMTRLEAEKVLLGAK